MLLPPPLLLCPAGTCLLPSNAALGSRGALADFFVCYDPASGANGTAKTWLPTAGSAPLAGYLAAGFHTRPCDAAQEACAVCSWLVPDALPTPALARSCAVCNGSPR